MGFFHPEYFRDTPDTVSWARDPDWPIGTVAATDIGDSASILVAGQVSATISEETAEIYGLIVGQVAADMIMPDADILGAGTVDAYDFTGSIELVCPLTGTVAATMHDIVMGAMDANLLNIGTVEAVDAGCNSRIIVMPGWTGIVAGTFCVEESEILGWDSSPGTVEATMAMGHELDIYIFMQSLIADDALQFVR